MARDPLHLLSMNELHLSKKEKAEEIINTKKLFKAPPESEKPVST
jgi:hypothetical protein